MSVGISLGTAALIGGVASAGGAITSGVLGANAAKGAANTQANEAQQALDFQKQVWQQQQQNQAPFIAAGQESVGKLMQGVNNGTFGPGSIAPFKAPTAAEAAATPGYQFTQQQGQRGVLAAASAGGRSLSGGTLKAIDEFNTGLANTTYGDTFNRALSTYQAQLAGQGQAYNQLAGIAGTGQTAVQNIGQVGAATANNVGNLMTGIGNAQASGIIGSANAYGGAIGGATNGLGQALLYNALFGSGGYNPSIPGINAQGGIGSQPLPPPPEIPPADFGVGPG